MRKLETQELDLMPHARYFSKLFRWNSDREICFDECEFLYDRDGNLLGVDYRLDGRTARSTTTP